MVSQSTYARELTSTYAKTDVEDVLRKLRADFNMIGQSTGAITFDKIDDYMHDISLLAINGYIYQVDISQTKFGEEIKAVKYTFRELERPTETNFPGGVVWSPDPHSEIEVVLTYSESYTAVVERNFSQRLKIQWIPAYDDLDHPTLNKSFRGTYAKGNIGLDQEVYN